MSLASSRRRHYAYVRSTRPPCDELPWVRVPGIASLALPQPVVLVNGAFDLLHASHWRVIAAARDKAGDAGTVVCALDSDERVRAAKGPGRPILTWVERATALGFTPIDYLVEIGSDEEMGRLIAAIRPALRVQGADHEEHPSKFPGVPKAFVANRGIHTSEIVRRILEKC